ncbi:oligosaccharide flippase family protein [Amaricoccus solimangrovi]|uniref:Polysaccharide biosynthesis protein n=1 Tax=Amaricoccus solimangrovi TaxID=2589815 RepID=A0A501WIB6_9RHOB|nr:oligosaccharide flippase family protein [Amaricoccus solimangrovi]TPE48522.1 polysaccharide biosynthesis protein [Amaricoccus solimangrovi]
MTTIPDDPGARARFRPARRAAPLADPGLVGRVLRGSAFVILGYGASQAIRLASNLILTRLLFPEAFGLMALVTVAMIGLGAFSDVGVGPAIAHSRRGDDPAFLHAAYTLQVGRGFALWIGACLVAWPVAAFYGEPALARLLPAVGFCSVITGFNSVAVETAHRHLLLGRVTLIELASQAAGTIAMVILAFATRSIWALVLGGAAASAAKLALSHLCLPGPPNRLGWEPAARRELVRFGRWIFLSTLCGFLLSQGDKLILGKYLPLELLGIYNIGFFLASFPLLLGKALTERMVIPLYREHPPARSARNFARLRRMRAILTGGILALLALMAFSGVWLVDLLYDARFATAGPIVVLIAVAQMPQAIGLTYDLAALAAGESRRFFLQMAPRALAQAALLLLGAASFGLPGALGGQALAAVLTYPLIVRLARRYGAWDAAHDAGFAALGLLLGGLALWARWPEVAGLASLG